MRTVSGRLTLLSTGICTLALGAFAASLYAWVEDGQRRALEKEVATQLELFERAFLDELEQDRKSSLAPAIDAYLGAAGTVARVTRPSGAGVYASEGFERDSASHRVGSVRVKASSGEEFDLALGVPRAPFDHALRQLRLYFAIFLPVMAVLAWVLANLGVKRLLSPLEDIRRQAERISRQNVSERIPLGPLYGELGSLARTFNEMLDRLDQALQDLRNFAADAAHELRTPLANLRAELETAVQRAHTREEHERILSSVSEEVSRMSRIVTDLLTLAQIDLRQYALQKERVRLLPLLEETRETWESAAAERKITILLEGQDVEVAGDPVALRRIFMNLVHNAVKYNREGGRITVSVSKVGPRARVRVEDTGMGIPAEHLPHLFRRFYRVDQARSRDSGGAGLGLAVCKSFVEAHEGAIAVESASGRGSAFTVDLPALETRGIRTEAPARG